MMSSILAVLEIPEVQPRLPLYPMSETSFWLENRPFPAILTMTACARQNASSQGG